MSTAVEIVAEAYRRANMDKALTSFSTSQEFPYDISLDLLNKVLKSMNRMGNYWFSTTTTALPYSVGVATVDLGTLSIDPKRIFEVRRTLTNYWGKMDQIQWSQFQRWYRQATTPTQTPYRYSILNDTLEYDAIPDQDYSIKAYHFKDMPVVTATTDTLLVPVEDEDIISDGVRAMLLQAIGRPDFREVLSLWTEDVKNLLADMKQSQGLPTQMPAAF